MNLEIEHKFLILEPPHSELLMLAGKRMIVQHYLSRDIDTERIRNTVCMTTHDSWYSHTVKTPGPNNGNWEKDTDISRQEYMNYISKVNKNFSPISKIRYTLPYKTHKLELDRFMGPVSFWLLEVEVNDFNEDITLPETIGSYIDVTNNKCFSNHKISVKPNKTLRVVEQLLNKHNKQTFTNA